MYQHSIWLCPVVSWKAQNFLACGLDACCFDAGAWARRAYLGAVDLVASTSSALSFFCGLLFLSESVPKSAPYFVGSLLAQSTGICQLEELHHCLRLVHAEFVQHVFVLHTVAEGEDESRRLDAGDGVVHLVEALHELP